MNQLPPDDPPVDPAFAAWVASFPVREGPFVPFAYYDADGDMIEVFASNESYYGKWINPHLILYLSEDTGRVIGCAIEGVKGLMEKQGEKSND